MNKVSGKWVKTLFIVVIAWNLKFSGGTTADNDLSLTLKQKQTLDKFKDAVSSKLPHDYMKQDIYLVRWLRVRNFDLDQAQQLLMQNLKWREENKMDNILKEDWSDMDQDFPYRLDSRDKEGKPVMIGEFGHWDLRNAEITGRFERLKRHGEKIMEEEETIIRQLQSQGKLVTRAMVIMDMDGFNLVQHICSRCLNFLLQFYQSFELHYPGLLDRMFVVNNHPLVNTVLGSMLASFAPHTRRVVTLHDRNKAEYSKVLLKYIDADQLPEAYGGKKKL